LSFFSNLKIGHRLYIAFAVVLILLFTLAVYSMYQMDKLSEQTENIYNHPLTVSNAVLRINAYIVKTHREMKDVALSTSIEAINEHAQIVDNLEEKIFEDFKIIDTKFLGEKEKYKKARDVFIQWKPIRDEVVELMLNGEKQKAANITMGKGARHVIKIEEAMDSLGDFAQIKAREFLSKAKHTKELSFNSLYFMIFISLIISIASALLVTKSITAPLEIFTKATEKIGGGNLDAKLISTQRTRSEIWQRLSIT